MISKLQKERMDECIAEHRAKIDKIIRDIDFKGWLKLMRQPFIKKGKKK